MGLGRGAKGLVLLIWASMLVTFVSFYLFMKNCPVMYLIARDNVWEMSNFLLISGRIVSDLWLSHKRNG